VVCHDHEEQVTESNFVKSFRLTRNPIQRFAERTLIKKDGATGTPSIVEEGRIHLDLSLVLAVYTEDWNEEAQRRDLKLIHELLQDMRIAGGSLLPPIFPQNYKHRPWIADFTNDEDNDFHKLKTRLLPGSALVARDDLVEQRLEQLRKTDPDATPLDAWLSHSRINWHYDVKANNGNGAWQSDHRKGSGWIVPIPVGYGALGKLHAPGTVANTRDTTTPFRFVESLYSMGEWIGPHRLRSAQELLWYADSKPEEGLYRCRNDYYSDADIGSTL